jgi:hypothetical protein
LISESLQYYRRSNRKGAKNTKKRKIFVFLVVFVVQNPALARGDTFTSITDFATAKRAHFN